MKKNSVTLFIAAMWVAVACLFGIIILVGIIFRIDMTGILAYGLWGIFQLILLSLVIYIAWRVKLWIELQVSANASGKTDMSAIRDEIIAIRRTVEETHEKVERLEKMLDEVSE